MAQPWTPGQTLMLSWQSIRGKGRAEEADRKARVPVWFILLGILFAVGIAYTLLL